MKNIHLLPTDKDSNLFIGDLSGQLHFNYSIEKGSSRNQHIYITSDEEIKEGVNQWYLDKFLNKPRNSSGSQYGEKQDVIILTTDQDLIKDGVQAIDDDFLEWFVHNPSCEWVEVIYTNCANCVKIQGQELSPDCCHNYQYKIIIPKEEQCTCKKHDPYCCHIHGSCPTCVKKEEPNQETLEEAAKNYSKTFIEDNGTLEVDFKAGAKWQQERMYSEEEVLELLRKAHFVEQNIEEWFEQFKK